MIKKYNGAESKKAEYSVGEPLPRGAYICKIMSAETLDYSWGQVVKLSVDVAEGEYKDFFAAKYRNDTNGNKKWKGTFRITVPDDSRNSQYKDSEKRAFDNFMFALEDSNRGYHFDWDERKLKGLLIGLMWRNKEWEMDGNTGWTTEASHCLSISDVRDGNFKLPKDKPLKNNNSTNYPAPNSLDIVDDGSSDDDLPF